MTVCGRTTEDLTSELVKYKLELEQLRLAFAHKCDENNSWVELYNAMRGVALDFAWRANQSVNIDALAIKRRDQNRIDNALRKPT